MTARRVPELRAAVLHRRQVYTLTITREFGETTTVATSLDSEHEFHPVQGSFYVPGRISRGKIPRFKFGVFLPLFSKRLSPNNRYAFPHKQRDPNGVGITDFEFLETVTIKRPLRLLHFCTLTSGFPVKFSFSHVESSRFKRWYHHSTDAIAPRLHTQTKHVTWCHHHHSTEGFP